MPFIRFVIMYLFKLVISFLFCVLSFVGCAPQTEQAATDLQVWVSLLPQQSIVQSIVGERGQVEVMVRPGQSPETYSPSVPQMASLAKADVYFGIGMPLERVILGKMERSMPQLRFVQTADLNEDAHEHVHGLDEHHVHGEEDPHVWMDPQWMLGFVAQVRDTLIELAPESSELFTVNAAVLSAELEALDAKIAAQLKPFAGRCFYINHPSLGYFAARYGLVQKSIEQGGAAPSAKQVSGLVKSAKAEQVRAIFTQPEFGRSSAGVLASASDVELVEVDVLSGEYFSNMLDIAQSLEDSFK